MKVMINDEGHEVSERYVKIDLPNVICVFDDGVNKSVPIRLLDQQKIDALAIAYSIGVVMTARERDLSVELEHADLIAEFMDAIDKDRDANEPEDEE